MTASARRAGLVERLKATRILHDIRVEAALSRVPRELFLPHVPLAQAYEDGPVPIKFRHGGAISSASQPTMVAIMLQLLDAAPGARILEIGTGSGYNAALLAHLVTAAGSVTSIDIEPDLVEAARERLRNFPNVFVEAADGARGYAANAPYDRIIVTAAAGDLEVAWWEQLHDGGIIVVPIALDAIQHCVAFRRTGTTLQGVATVECSFIALRGMAAAPPSAEHSSPQIWRASTTIWATPTSRVDHTAIPRGATIVRRPATTFVIRPGD